jgi:tetratricopeptide (TPR) repeat protein
MFRCRLSFAALTATIVAACLAQPAVAFAQTAPPASKADQQRAKAVAKEGETLFKAKKYAEGRAKFVEALRFDNNPKYTMKIVQVDAQIDNQIKKSLHDAEELFQKGKYDEALARLDGTVSLRAVDPAVLYDRALIAFKLGKRSDAVSHLDRALGAVTDEKERIRLLQLKTQWETGEAVQQPPSGHEDAIKDLNDVLASGETAADTCSKIRAVAAGLTRSASLVFNLAKCAEDEGKLEEASQLVDEYLKLAPDATDKTTTQAGLDEARELEQRAGPEIVALYGEADRAARSGFYKRSIDAMRKAIEAAPQIPESHLKLARLHQASGNAADARTHYTRYLDLENREAPRAVAQQELASLEQRSAQYESIIGPARTRMLAWLHRFLVEGHPMGTAASQDELATIAKDLQQAAVMMPLAVDVGCSARCTSTTGTIRARARRSPSSPNRARPSGSTHSSKASTAGKSR